jgi:hypothetical protein
MVGQVAVRGDRFQLVLRVSAYELPDSEDFDDGNWLVGEVDLEAGKTGSFKASHRVALRADELRQFRDDLVPVARSSNGTATLTHMEGQLGCEITLEDGKGSLTAFVREHVGSELRVRDCEIDQSYLAETIRELNTLLENFPVRGER